MSDTAEETRPRWVPYVPQGFEGTPVDEVDALRRGKAVLQEEAARWTRGTWFNNQHPEVDPEDPFCNSWRTCAEGAVMIVTIGLVNTPSLPEGVDDTACPWVSIDNSYDHLRYGADSEQSEIYIGAKRLLTEVGSRISYWKTGYATPRAGAYSFNDGLFETPTDVLRWFNEAIEHAIAKREEAS